MSGERRDFGLGLHRRDGAHPATARRHNPVDIVGMTKSRTPPSSVHGVDAVADAIVTASRLLIAVSASSIAAVDETITIPQFRALVVLRESGPLNVTELADDLGVQPSTINRMVDQLQTADLVSRREEVLTLTETGNNAVTQVTQQRRKEIARIVAKMPPERRTQLVEALEALSEAGGEPAADEPRDDWI